jgi:hypothetical protein
MWTATFMCVYEGQYGSAMYGVLLCAIHSSDVICGPSYVLVFVIYSLLGRVFLPLI